jgi:chromosome segregation ATPase
MNISRLLRIALLGASLSVPALLLAQDNDLASLRAKAEKGNAIAQYNLGLAYAEGRGITADPIEAYVWLSLAMENGARGNALNTLVTTLDAATIAAAKQKLADRHTASGATPAPTPAIEAPTPTAAAPVADAPVSADAKKLSTELAQAWKEVESLKTELSKANETAPAIDQLRQQRDSLSAKLGEVVAELATTRAEREKLQALAAQNEKAGQATAELGRAAQEKARLAELHSGELSRELETAKTELDRAKASIAALQQAPSPAADTTAVDQKARELQSALADLDIAREAVQRLSGSRAKLEVEKNNLEHMLNTAQTSALESGKQADALKAQVAELTQKIKDAPAPVAAAATPTAPAYPDLSARVKELEAALAATANAKPAAPSYPDLSERVKELEASLATASAAAKPATPAYPDLSTKVAELQADLVAARKPAAPSYPDLSGRVQELEAALAAAKPAAPAYPDLSGRVAELEAALAAVANPKPAAPAYPDLASRVKELEASLTETQSALRAEQAKAANVASAPAAPVTTVTAAPAAADSDTSKELAETQLKLETALRAYTLLAREHDELAARSTKSSESLATDRDSLSAKLADAENRANAAKDEAARLDAALTALQRSTSETSRDYASQQVLLRQMRGANTVLAQENYQLKAALARDPNAPRMSNTVTPVPVPSARNYTVVAGDSLSKISQRYYGTPQRWREIYNANLDRLRGESSLKVGLELRIP